MSRTSYTIGHCGIHHSGLLCQDARIFCWLTVLLFLLCSCGADRHLKKAEKYAAIGEYFDAANEYKRAYSMTAPKDRERRGQIALKMARCNEKINSTPKALAAYRNAMRYGQGGVADRLAFARPFVGAADGGGSCESFGQYKQKEG